MAHTEIISPTSPELLVQVALIFREYAQSLSIDLGFQGFEDELATLPGDYAAPRGALMLAMVDGVVAGCCALRPLDTSDYANTSEMKRLYVRPAFRRFGLGRLMAQAIAQHDIITLRALIFLFAATILTVHSGVGILQATIDPRLRRASGL